MRLILYIMKNQDALDLQDEIFQNIQSENPFLKDLERWIQYESSYQISENLQHLLNCICSYNIYERPTISEIKSHPWFKEEIASQSEIKEAFQKINETRQDCIRKVKESKQTQQNESFGRTTYSKTCFGNSRSQKKYRDIAFKKSDYYQLSWNSEISCQEEQQTSLEFTSSNESSHSPLSVPPPYIECLEIMNSNLLCSSYPPLLVKDNILAWLSKNIPDQKYNARDYTINVCCIDQNQRVDFKIRIGFSENKHKDQISIIEIIKQGGDYVKFKKIVECLKQSQEVSYLLDETFYQ